MASSIFEQGVDMKSPAILLNALALFFAGAAASAADLPSIKAPVAPPAFTWTGLHVGMSFGHTWTGSDPISLNSVNVFDNTLLGFGAASAIGATGGVGARLNGFLAGAQAGYDWQFAESFVAGLEADVQGAGVRGGGWFGNGVAASPASFVVSSAKLNRGLEYLGTVRARVGYAVTPTILVYATGGLAFGGANQRVSIQQTLEPSALLTRGSKGDQFQNMVGWTVGAGAEMALSRALSAKLEYLYYDLGELSLSGNAVQPLAFTGLAGGATRLVDVSRLHTRISGHLLRMGLNYRFDWSVPQTGGAATPLFAAPRFTQIASPAFGDWRFKVMIPYLWALGTNGALTARGNTFGADTSFIDGFTQTSSFPLAFAGRAEARNGPLALYADYAWFQARFSGSTVIPRSPTLDVAFVASAAGRLKQTMGFGEAGAAYEVARLKLDGSESTTAVDVYAGARVVHIRAEILLDAIGAANSELLGVDTIGGRSVARTGTMRWVDPLIGVGFRHQLSPVNEFQLRGDIGGFGVGSQFSWQTYGGFNHDFEYAGLKFTGSIGYRALSVNYSSGWGNNRKGEDAIFHGPLTGVSMRF